MKYYAVRRGREPGIYGSWTECQAQVFKFSGAVFKSFDDLEAAQEYINRDQDGHQVNAALPFAYIDGSFSAARGVYGYGGFLSIGDNRHIIQGIGNNPKYLPDRNIAGECLGALQVMHAARKYGIEEINLFFDYAGIENWSAGYWKARTPLARYYSDTADLMATWLHVHYCKIDGHTGIIGNEIADLLAKEAVGAQLTKKGMATLDAFRRGEIVADPSGRR